MVYDLDLSVRAGECVGIVGESGSGKSLTGLAMLNLLPEGVIASGGELRFGDADLRELSPRHLRRLRGKEVSMIFQDPSSALIPSRTVESQIVDILRTDEKLSRPQAIERHSGPRGRGLRERGAADGRVSVSAPRRSAGSGGTYSGRTPATLSRNTDADPGQPTRSANVEAGIVGVTANNARTCGANASKPDPTAGRWYFGSRSVSSARSTVPRETPTSRPISRFECSPVENSWRILAQSSILITFALPQ